MKWYPLVKNENGISMVEVMMAVAITGGLALTTAKLIENTSENTKVTEAKSENINLKGIIQNNLSNPLACKNTFGTSITQANLTSLTASPSNQVIIPNIKNKANVIQYDSSSTNVSPLKIESMYLTNYSAAAGTGDLIVQSTFKKSASQTLNVKPIRIPLNFSIDNTVPASPVLNGCGPMATGGEWMLGGNAGTVDGTDYLGTSDNVALNFKVNNQKAGRITSAGTTIFGYQAGAVNTAVDNTIIGHRTMNANTSGKQNVAIGFNVLSSNISGNWNYAIGYDALKLSTSNDNIAIGYNTLSGPNTSGSNIAIGMHALKDATSGGDNIAIGRGALLSNTTGQYNVAIGGMGNLTTGSSNTAVGRSAGGSVGSNGAQSRNSAFGMFSMQNAIGGGDNTAVGYQSLLANTTASFNSALGSGALFYAQNNYNTGVGGNAGYNYTSGIGNTFLGYRTGSTTYPSTGSRNIAIGYNAGTNLTAADSDKLHINNGVSATSLIEGDFSSAGRYVKFDANIAVGTTNTVAGNVNKNNLAVGNTNTLAAGASYSAVFGTGNTASGGATFAFGTGNNVSGWLTHAIGQSNTVNGNASMAFGWNNTVSGQRSFIMGSASGSTADYTTVIGIDSHATHSGAMVLSDYGSGGAYSWGSDTFTARFVGGYRFHTDYSGNTGVQLAAGGSSWGTISDRNAKENFVEIDPEEHLRKIAKLPVFRWNYKGQKKIPHMGPMAQDFYYIFKLGDGDDKMITTQEMEGVTIVAVKALEERTRKISGKLDSEVSKLRKENAELRMRLERLEELMSKKK